MSGREHTAQKVIILKGCAGAQLPEVVYARLCGCSCRGCCVWLVVYRYEGGIRVGCRCFRPVGDIGLKFLKFSAVVLSGMHAGGPEWC